jgi:cytosine/adenosine deaminase-related metal-dependent hydrolase
MNIEILGAFIVHPLDDTTVVEKKNIYIKDGIVHYEKPFQTADKSINAEGKILFPGLVNAHHHIYSTLSKGVPCEVPFRNFEGNLKQLWWTLDHSLNQEDMVLSTAIACKDSLKQGVTTVFDHHISGYTENSLSHMAEVFVAYGISGTIAFEISDRNGEDFFQKSLDENVRFAKVQKGKSVQGMIGLHASFTLSNESLQKIADASEDFPIHVHVAEGEIDGVQCQQKYKMGLIERFDSFGLLRENSLMIHCSNLTDKDLEILKKRNVFLAQAVDSNMNNALNIGNISKFISEGLKVTAGTDGMHSSAFKAYKNSMIFTKYLNKTCDIGYPEMSGLFLNSFKLKKAFGLPLGIVEGEPADIAIFDYTPTTPFNSEQFLGHFIFGITESECQYVVKKDEVLLDDFHVTKDLYNDLFDRSWDISKAMFERFEKNKGLY